jgi:hypothetical protein
MSWQKHIIKRQVIELQIRNDLNRTEIQDRASLVFTERLLPIIDDVLSEKSPAGMVHKIDRLELDAGRIAVSEFEDRFIDNVVLELQNKLRDAIENAREVQAIKRDATTTTVNSEIELVVYFLQTGVFPWWAQETTHASLEKALVSVLHQNSSGFKTILIALLQDDAVVKRMVYTFSDHLLAQITELFITGNITAGLLPGEGQKGSGSIINESSRDNIALPKDLSRQKQDREITSHPPARGRGSLTAVDGQFTSDDLNDLWPQRDKLFSVFTSGLTTQQLREYWWLSLYQTIGEVNIRSEKELFEVAGSLFVRLAAQKTSRTALRQYLLNDQTNGSILERLSSFTGRSLTNGLQDQWQKKEEENAADSTAVNAPVQNRDAAGEPSLQTPTVENPSSLIAAAKTDREGDRQFAEKTDPKQPSSLNAENKQPESLKANQDNSIQSHDASTDSSPGPFTKMDKAANELFSGKTAPTHSASNSESKKLDDVKTSLNTSFINNPKPFLTPFTNIEKIYILNAGLVLLWPFLHRFFENMGLADDKMFTTENAGERACLLLQYLVTGTTEDLFEAQLPLNKILCGIPLLQPLNTECTISDEEQAIAESFLLAVIGNGGVGWKNLSINGLRQAYVSREGILSSRDGNWLLQVKRETYDILVDRLPWTIQVVKLPWMERLIFVEW